MTLEGTIVNGRVELDRPADWPDGTRVTVDVTVPEGQPAGNNPYPLRGIPVRYDRPFEPAAQDDWEALK